MAATVSAQPVLDMHGISKSFAGVKAVSGVDLVVYPGQVHAVVGENGAGKSTLMKIIAGVFQQDDGVLEVDGQPMRLRSPRDARRLGVGMVYQELNLVPDMSVAENISLGRTPRRRGLVDRRAMGEIARDVLGRLGAEIDPWDRVRDLSVSQQQLVEICKVYAADPRIVVLDEPTSSLTEHEATALLGVVRRMRDLGTAIIYISHRLHEVMAIADRVTVMRDGHRIDSLPIEGLTPTQIIKLMVGRDLGGEYPKRRVPIGDVVLSVRGLTRAGAFSDITFDVRAGEIVGLAGLIGAGRTEVARAIFGLDRADSGEVTVIGKPVARSDVQAAVRAGIAYVPEDRKTHGVVGGLTIRENLSLAVLRRVSSAGVIRRAAERELAARYIARLGVAPAEPERRVITLSGGNQQKVVVGKWLATEPTVLILDEPTRGVDVGAKADIHRIIGDLVANGVAILMISSELPEILAVSDRIVVLHKGTATAVLEAATATEESVMHAATGVAAK